MPDDLFFQWIDMFVSKILKGEELSVILSEHALILSRLKEEEVEAWGLAVHVATHHPEKLLAYTKGHEWARNFMECIDAIWGAASEHSVNNFEMVYSELFPEAAYDLSETVCGTLYEAWNASFAIRGAFSLFKQDKTLHPASTLFHNC